MLGGFQRREPGEIGTLGQTCELLGVREILRSRRSRSIISETATYGEPVLEHANHNDVE